MTASGPGSGGTPDEPGGPGGTPPVPDHVWRMFLEDSEGAIRASAPREPSARERRPGWQPAQPPRPPRPPAEPAGAVGEMWRAEDPWPGPAWRELDGRARLRRAGRVLGAAAALALALTAWSQLSAEEVAPGGEPAATIGQRLEESPPVPTLASLAPEEPGTATPAVFEPGPSAVPRMSASPWTGD
ncbi:MULTISPECIES: hypothetical protein [Streptomyces]|uniref:hypothetical protein n=1 Tax=Streptomyces TaxID=1883 RepID=UPI0004CB5894|nr:MULTISPECIES: hypothetical protein [Streptomyces]AOW89075.1 hypothetical protein BC342_23990 [Streptomyces olivaceus]MBZ6106712.1 hypothetical protein [Streptomyces olivaceus]MBZ6108901.1 hypothetical protein [Streptomyces olivaceus]MBZ6122785.1 hypothetical protein [Streptomyces olivaceus]MBZ6143606.1 hypothetical protein [Streptomyces olivaceus]